jgi:hypothetical protein
MTLRWYTAVIDCHDIKAQSRWRADVLGANGERDIGEAAGAVTWGVML